MSVSFELSPEQIALREMAREFARKEILPMAREIDEKDEFPAELWEKMSQPPHMYTGIFIPEKYGGNYQGALSAAVIMEELVAVGKCGVAGVMIEAAGLSVSAIQTGGNEDQKRKYLPIVAKGEGIGCFALTEPGGGSDAAAIKTRAIFKDGRYVLNGRKRYASFASEAKYILVFAKTDPDKGARGISAFLVDKGTPGFSVIERVNCIGLRGHQDEEVLFKDCSVPEENLLGEEGKGLKYALGTLDKTRATLCAGFVGLARAILQEAVKFAKGKKIFGVPLATHQAVGFSLADLDTEIEAARLLTHKACWMSDQGVRHTVETARAKAFASKILLKAATVAMDTHGGYGCTKRFDIERLYRDARIWVFAQGAPNIQRLIVYRHLFKDIR